MFKRDIFFTHKFVTVDT